MSARIGRPPVSMAVKLENYAPEPTTGCWLWTGTVTDRGYGQVSRGDGRMVSAHRASYEHHVGTIPNGQFVCHRCDTPCCINPVHLFLSDQVGNMRDAYRKGRSKAAKTRARATCHRGHEYTAENTRVDRRGHRHCRECNVIDLRLRNGWTADRAFGVPNQRAQQ